MGFQQVANVSSPTPISLSCHFADIQPRYCQNYISSRFPIQVEFRGFHVGTRLPCGENRQKHWIPCMKMPIHKNLQLQVNHRKVKPTHFFRQ